MAAPPRRDDPGLSGQPKDWELDPETGRFQGYHHRLPESPTSSWVRKNFTFGNFLTIVAIVAGTGAWMRTTELAAASNAQQLATLEVRVSKVETQTPSKELLDARLAVIGAELAAIRSRLEVIEKTRR